MPDDILVEPLRAKRTENGLIIEIPLRHAEGLQTHLQREGVATTLHVEPWDKEARLEVWPGPDEATVQRALDGWHRQ